MQSPPSFQACWRMLNWRKNKIKQQPLELQRIGFCDGCVCCGIGDMGTDASARCRHSLTGVGARRRRQQGFGLSIAG